MTNLQAFFAHNKKQNENIKRAISKSFVDEKGNPMVWEFAAISPARDEELKTECTKRSMITQGKRKGQYNTNFDNIKYQRLLTIESIVHPNLNDQKLQDSYGVMGANELLSKMLTIGELTDASRAAQEVNGFDIEIDELVEEAKN